VESALDQPIQSPNHLLASLPAADFDAVRPHLRPVELRHETVLFEVGETIDRVYFPHSGVISLVVSLASGEMIETGMVGCDSLLGGSSALDGKVSLNKAIVQIPGAASVLGLDHLRHLADVSVAFRTTLIRHEQLILVQAQQSAACNITHTVEARLARWLLRCRDLMDGDDLALTQEFVSQMLGVRRTSVSIVAGTLQQAGLIRYRRGHIRILDLQGLQDGACECYETVRSQSERLLGTKLPRI
jgi:CRP-like cAMP-binding protein